MTASPTAYSDIQQRISTAALKAGRRADDVTLVAVTKTQPQEKIMPLLQAGHRVFGENRVQEAKSKFPLLRQQFPDIELHLIGPLQSNKAAEAVALFDVIESVDRDRIAETLAKEMQRQHKTPRLLVQVNTGLEPQKAGIVPGEAANFVSRLGTVHGLKAEGLMCIPPADEPAGPHFDVLAKLACNLGLSTLSMGMSGDYEEAIAHGASHVRVGSALFGARS